MPDRDTEAGANVPAPPPFVDSLEALNSIASSLAELLDIARKAESKIPRFPFAKRDKP